MATIVLRGALTRPLTATELDDNFINLKDAVENPLAVSLTSGAGKVSGILGVLNGGTGVTVSTGSGSNVLSISPTLVTPLLGIPTSGILTNCTGLPLTSGITGTLPVSNGGTGSTSITFANLTTNVAGILPVSNGGTNLISVGASGNILTSNGTVWVSSAPATNVSSFSAGSTGLTPSTTTSGAITLAGTLAIANGGTGTTTPALVAGSNVSITGTWPNQTINAASGGGGGVSPNVANTWTALQTFSSGLVISGAYALRGSYGAGAIISNFAAGDNALVSNTSGIWNSAVGYGTLRDNTGSANTAVGYFALKSNTTVSNNTAVGSMALQANTTGDDITAVGSMALQVNTTGINGAAVGSRALRNNTIGNYNSAVGAWALSSNTIGVNNAAVGASALSRNTIGNDNSAVGAWALYSNTTGVNNSAVGAWALYSNTTGVDNAAMGRSALYNNTTGGWNSAMGVSALYSNTTGFNNAAVGASALYSNTTGSGNTAINPLNSTGTYAPVFNPTTENDRLCLGSTGVTNAYVAVGWTFVSDARDKTNFASVPHGLDFVTKLQPWSYQFKKDRETDIPTGIVRYGFKAQDILALEGESPVIVDIEDLDKLRFNPDSLIPVLVNAIKELTARLETLERKL